MKRKIKVLIVILAIALLLPGLEGNLVSAGSAGDINFDRLEGTSRVGTAIAISQKAYRKNDTVILAGYDGEPDALASSFLAGQEDAPLLLVHKDKVSDELQAQLKSLDAKNIILLGGEKAISQKVENILRQKYNVERYDGENRAETAIEIIEKSGKKVSEVFLARGYDNLADALAIGTVSAKNGIPVLLTRPGSMPKETLDYIKNNNIKKITVLGGEKAVNQKVLNSLPQNIRTSRIQGKNRNETAIKIAEEFLDDADSILVANRDKYIDALTGGYFGAKNSSPVLLVEKDSVCDEFTDYVNKGEFKNITLLGGEKVLSAKVMRAIKGIAGEDVEPEFNPVSTLNAEYNRVISGKNFYLNIENQVVDLINKSRRAEGLKPLTINQDLVKLGRVKSADMAQYSYFDHTSPNYGDMSTFYRKYIDIGRFAAENIMKTWNLNAGHIHDVFMNSPGHRDNRMDPRATEVGIGIVQDPSVSKTYYYITEVFRGR